MDNQRRKVGQTSTNIGHVYSQPLPFYINTCKNAPLPPVLTCQNRVPASAHFSLTSHMEHDRKPLNGPLYNEIHSKAPAHWTTHFLNKVAHRLRDHLTDRVVSKPISEMQDHYRGQSATQDLLGDYQSMMQALYRQLDTSQEFMRQPVLCTTKTDFKRFSRSDLTPFSVMDAASFNGPLTKSGAHSRLPALKAPSTLAFQPQLPRLPFPLPHRGRSSLYMESFTVPVPPPTLPPTNTAQIGKKQQEDCGNGVLLGILGVPKMYSTENQVYGGNKMFIV
ncbi:protein lin-7 homolog B isoform X1 [Xyrauchen texanus]|uniref:protein lin-7 homolog B isoform X1 n=1 Tax=Xyrauchen texanus TaxID=154827 RepID=UPI002242A7A5|nr:protein lin-7 homolog B isoform X1 [Xyrauchen texanus]